jgi:hypothetical protein
MKSFENWVDDMSTEGWNEEEPTSIEKTQEAISIGAGVGVYRFSSVNPMPTLTIPKSTPTNQAIILNGESIGFVKGFNEDAKYIPSQQVKYEVIKEYQREILCCLTDDSKPRDEFTNLIASIIGDAYDLVPATDFKTRILKLLEENK